MATTRSAKIIILWLLALLVTTPVVAGAKGSGALDFPSYEWTEVSGNAEWSPRAGLQVLSLGGDFYMMGGRTPRAPSFPPIPGDSDIWGDVWKSADLGASWTRILETDDAAHWPARAYFRAVEKGAYMYVLGGQNYRVTPNPSPVGPPFISVSDFFNDVWRSKDGVRWQRMTADAGWDGRAGLSAVVFKDEIFVMGGSFNDDPAVIGGPPTRVYFNDVWKSKDGSRWTLVTEHASWAPRAGAVMVVKNGYMYLLGGEDGFTCLPGGRCPPYFNDVWRSRDGASWELVTQSADWAPRPGHQAAVLHNTMVLFGGFGLSSDPANPFAPANPMDIWVSKDGASWEQVSDSPWNATTPAQIKYDFAVVVASGSKGGPAIYTFGGDRETFNFADPTNYLNVDNDVWRYSPPVGRGPRRLSGVPERRATRLNANVPNPFNPTTMISFELAAPAHVSLRVYSVSGTLVRTLVEREMSADQHRFVWDGLDAKGAPVSSGVYFYELTTEGFSQTRKMLMIK